MIRQEAPVNIHQLMFSATLFIGFAMVGGFSQQVDAEPYEWEMMLQGAPVESKISGSSGTRRTLEGEGNDYAMYGISSQERKDHPCTIWIGTESLHDKEKKRGENKNLCGGTPTSRTIKAEYRDHMEHGPRVFANAIRVCTNKKGTRVKGFQLRGLKIYEMPPPPSEPVSSVGILTAGSMAIEPEPREEYVNDSETPADFRNNCKEWKKWAECPNPGQIATGLIAHFEAGKEPRSLTGVALLCRHVSRP
ncbi:MAG: hypothetical protein NPIRA06_19330 [Nitrospirales bacterium]|nr:MAG: hypothetical protein NPIRA06_19330 [Nitrospirales bacterium]